LGWAGLGWAGLGWAGLGCAGLGWVPRRGAARRMHACTHARVLARTRSCFAPKIHLALVLRLVFVWLVACVCLRVHACACVCVRACAVRAAGAIIVTLHPLYKSRRSTANIIIERPSRQYGSPCDGFSTSNLYYLVVGDGDAATATIERLRRQTSFGQSTGWRQPGIVMYS